MPCSPRCAPPLASATVRRSAGRCKGFERVRRAAPSPASPAVPRPISFADTPPKTADRRAFVVTDEKNATPVALFESVRSMIDYSDLRNRNKSLFCAASMPISGADFTAQPSHATPEARPDMGIIGSTIQPFKATAFQAGKDFFEVTEKDIAGKW